MLGGLIVVVFFVKWCAANAMSSQTVYLEIADLAIDWAPSDPQAHYAAAVLHEKTQKPEDLTASLAAYEQATALSPNDFRTWLALGRARERNGGDRAGAEAVLRKARELAPNYAEIKWILGNVLLREGKTSEAFAELRAAAETDARYLAPTLSTAWLLSNGELPQIIRYLGDSDVIKAAMVGYLAREKRFDEAVEMWSTLPADKKKTVYSESGGELFTQLIGAKKIRRALQVLAEIGDDAGEKFVEGEVFNGGFEADVKAANASIFEWRMQDGALPQIGIDNTQKHHGGRSLVTVFNSPTGREFRSVSQTVAVEPGKKYVFEVFYKSELKTTATISWQIADVSGSKILAATPAIAATSDWTNLKAEFTVPADTEAVTIFSARETCKSTLCPISGRVWFDDLSLAR